MKHLKLMQLGDDTWAATCECWVTGTVEEAHNIQGDSIKERLQAAATVWGLELDNISYVVETQCSFDPCCDCGSDNQDSRLDYFVCNNCLKERTADE